METVKMAAQEMNRAIAELREPLPECVSEANFDKDVRHGATAEWLLDLGNKKSIWTPRKDYLTDANAALELLEEVRATNEYDICPTFYAHCDEDNWGVLLNPYCNQGGDEIYPEHKDLKVAICLAWFQWKTGKRVELTRTHPSALTMWPTLRTAATRALDAT